MRGTDFVAAQALNVRGSVIAVAGMPAKVAGETGPAVGGSGELHPLTILHCEQLLQLLLADRVAGTCVFMSMAHLRRHLDQTRVQQQLLEHYMQRMSPHVAASACR